MAMCQSSLEIMVNNTLFWKNKRVLITGHTGFKGSWLALWLLSMGADVWGYGLEPNEHQKLFTSLFLDDASLFRSSSRLHHRIGDIKDLDELTTALKDAQADIVFHLAAQPLVQQSYIDPLDTWLVNVHGSLNLLESLKLTCYKKTAVVMITTDKVYQNNNWDFGYRETDPLGGHDPYSASKAAAEIAIASWRSSFCGTEKGQTSKLLISTARAGNVIGGGDWSPNRILPDVIKAIQNRKPIQLRNPNSSRPWQHVLEPLSGYLQLAEKMYCYGDQYCQAYNFGPDIYSCRSVRDLTEEVLTHCHGSWNDVNPNAPHEAARLHLNSDKSFNQLGWKPRWSFEKTVEATVNWYLKTYNNHDVSQCCLHDISDFLSTL